MTQSTAAAGDSVHVNTNDTAMVQFIRLHACGRGAGLVVVSPADHLLAGWPEEDGVLVLRSVTSLSVAQRGVRLNNPNITEVLQAHQVLGLPKPAGW